MIRRDVVPWNRMDFDDVPVFPEESARCEDGGKRSLIATPAHRHRLPRSLQVEPHLPLPVPAQHFHEPAQRLDETQCQKHSQCAQPVFHGEPS